jgi:hypothetical protein
MVGWSEELYCTGRRADGRSVEALTAQLAAVRIRDRMKKILLLSTLAVLTLRTSVGAQQPPEATELLEHAIAYHDPDGLWNRSRFRLEIRETRPDGDERHTRIQFDTSRNTFEILTQQDGHIIEGLMADDDCVLTLDGSLDVTAAERQEYRLTCERLAWRRDYYTYLWGLPMKLRDPGTRLETPATAAEYQGRAVWSIRVTYDESVGHDTWYFYFDRQTSALVGYRFYHHEADNDGEYILLKGEVDSGGMKIPARRSWYTHAEDKYLGDDILTELEVIPR